MVKSLQIFLIVVALNCNSFSQIVTKSMLRLPDTGQTNSYTNTFGEDNDYNFNAPYFIVNGNGTVTDTITGLMWQQADGGEMTIQSAINYCNNLSLGGHSDWRLPNAHEGFSILNEQNTNPALNSSVFTTTLAEYWWTSTRQANDTNKVWATNAGGGIGNHPKTETISAGGLKKFHVRAVRDAQVPLTIPQHFTNNNDGTITDNLTNLTWQQLPYNDTLSWENALYLADTFSLAQYADWRLPNIKELHSLNNESLINPSVSTTFFPNIGIKKYWSSTSLINPQPKAWFFDTHFGITTYANKTTRLNVLLVRGNGNIATSIQSNENVLPIEVFPNPFSSHINIKGIKQSQAVTMYNSLGLIIYEGNNISENDFSKLTSGIYFIRLTNKCVKLVKE